MRIRVEFGLGGQRKEMDWYQPIEDFPKRLIFDGKRWEWFMWEEIDIGTVKGTRLMFTEIPPYDPNFSDYMVDFESAYGFRVQKCECGSSYTSFPQFHMFMCPLWEKQ